VYFMGVKCQCHILWEVKCYFLNIVVKSANWKIVQGVKYIFPIFLKLRIILDGVLT
jgi:hypothetical protein